MLDLLWEGLVPDKVKGWACVGYVIILFIAIIGFGLISSLKNQEKDSQERGKETDSGNEASS